MSIEDDLETDVESLRRELLHWILTELRSGARRDTRAVLAPDLVDVVRGGLQGAVDQAIRRVEEARVDGVVEALNPTFAEIGQALRGLQASLQASIATELSDRAAGADARFANLERSIAEVQRALAGLAERRAAAARGADRTDEILREIRRLAAEPEAPGRSDATPARRAASETPATPAPTWAMVAAVAGAAALVAGLGGWFAHGTRTATLAPETDLADQAHQLQASLDELAGAAPAGGSAAPKVDPQTIAGDVADVAGAMEQAANATDADDLRKAHQQANDAIAQLQSVLAFTSKPSPSQTAGPTSPPPPPPPPAHITHTVTPPAHHAPATGHSPAGPAPTSPPAAPPPAGGAPAPGGGGA